MARRDGRGGPCAVLPTITTLLFVTAYLSLIACSGVVRSTEPVRGWAAAELELLARFRARQGADRLREARALTPILANYLDVGTLDVAVGWSDAPTREELLEKTGPADNVFGLAKHPSYLGASRESKDLSPYQVLIFDIGCDDGRRAAAARQLSAHEPFCRTLDVVLFNGRAVHASIAHDAPENTARWLAAR